MGFLKDGVSIRDFEKLATGFAFLCSVATILYLAAANHYVSETLCLFSGGLGSLFVVRKIAKYNLDKTTTTPTDEESQG